MSDDYPFIFIAGPYAVKGRQEADDYAGIETNIQQARTAAIFLARHDIPYFCPHLNSAHMEVDAQDVPREFWLRLDLTILRYATGIWLLEGGCRSLALQKALEWGIHVWGPSEGNLLAHYWKVDHAIH